MAKTCEKENQLESTTSEEIITEEETSVKGIWGGIFAEFFQALMDNSLIHQHKNIASSIEYSLEKQKDKLKKDQKEFTNYMLMVLVISAIFLGVGIKTSNFISLGLFAGTTSLYIVPSIITFMKKASGNKKSNIYLEEMLIEENQIIEDLEVQQNKGFEQAENEIEVKNVLSKMNDQAVLNYDYGYNYKKWMLYYKIGKLRNRLEKKGYTEEDCNRIENWLAYDKFKTEENSLLKKLER